MEDFDPDMSNKKSYKEFKGKISLLIQNRIPPFRCTMSLWCKPS